jgi:hypothetical protein
MHTTLPFAALLALTLVACGDAPSEPHAEQPVASPAVPAREAPPASAKLALSGTITYEGPINGPKLFLSVKDPGQPGPPLAAKQLPPGPFPMQFTLTEADLMQMGGAPRAIPATVALLVRLDADGDAMTKDPSEPLATLKTPATTADLAITLAVP